MECSNSWPPGDPVILEDDQADWLFESDRTRGEVLAGLELLISDPDIPVEELEALEEDQ